MDIIDILKKYMYLILIFAVFFAISFMYLNNLLKKKKKKSYALKGLLLDLSKWDVLAMSFVLVNSVLLFYFLVFKLEINSALFICSNVFLIGSFILHRSLKNFINIFINILNIAVIYLNTYIISLSNVLDRKIYLLTQISVNVFGILFFLFTMLYFIKSIALGGDKNEDE